MNRFYKCPNCQFKCDNYHISDFFRFDFDHLYEIIECECLECGNKWRINTVH